MDHQINLGIQVVPIASADLGYPVIDKCIELIQNSGIDYLTIMDLVTKINKLAISNTEELVVNIRIHAKQNADVYMIAKTDHHNSKK